MQPTFKLGRLFGVDIGVHYSWLVIAVLIVISLAGHFQQTDPQWGTGPIFAFAIATAILFFASILAHELSHAAIARKRGLPVKSITLFALGGVANIGKESSDARSEFWIAIAGPITSVAIGLVFLALAGVSVWSGGMIVPSTPLWTGFLWLGYINVALAAFNMIPGYPLDGGRVLKSIVWYLTGNRLRATQIASGVGQFFAMGFIALGLFRFVGGAGLGGLWIAFIGWFLSQANSATRIQAEATAALENVNVGSVMLTGLPTVDGNINLRIFAEEYLMPTGHRCFVVLQGQHEYGLVTMAEVKNVPRERWPFTTLSDIALPLEDSRTVTPETLVTDALELMAQENVNLLPVIAGRTFVGVVTRFEVLQFLQRRTELKAA